MRAAGCMSMWMLPGIPHKASKTLCPLRIAKLFDVSLDYLLGLRRDRVSYREQGNVIVVPKALPKSEYPKIEEYIQFLLSQQDKYG